MDSVDVELSPDTKEEIMADVATAIPRMFRPPAPQAPVGPLSPLRLLRAIFFNPLHVWSRQHFEDLVVVERTMLGARLLISDPALIKLILVDNADRYVRDSLQQRLLYRVTGRGVFTAEGNDWQVQRKVLAPHFSAKALAAYTPGIAAAARDTVSRLSGLGNESFDLGREMWTMAVDVLGRTVFTGGLDEPPASIASNLHRFSNSNGQVEVGDLLRLPPWMPGVRRLWGWRATAQVRQRGRRILAKAKASTLSPMADFLSAQISAGSSDSGRTIHDRTIEDNISAILGAGSDTAAVALMWSIFLLSQVPRVREAVEAEVDANLGDGVPTAETLSKLMWTRAVIEEAMRLYPPAPLIGRMSCSEERLGGELFPAGTTILISPWVLHRHARLWSEPDMFEPERFLPGRREQSPRFTYLPFGSGPRVCLGMGLALQEAIIALATLIKHLRFERADDQPIRLRHCMTLHTDAPLRMRASLRQTP